MPRMKKENALRERLCIRVSKEDKDALETIRQRKNLTGLSSVVRFLLKELKDII